MMRRVHLVVFAVLAALCGSSAHGASAGSVSGVVRDSAGVPQIGAEVQLLLPDLSLAARVYTDENGHFRIASVLPGRYAVKALGAWFLPALREDVKVRANTIVNLTLNTLYEAMQWLPAEPRAGNAQPDDWKWTLRSAANRPLLRWLEDGPLVVVSDRSGAHSKLKARLVASGQVGSFGESGERISVNIEDTPSDSRELLAHVEFDPATSAGMESMLGFRQDLGLAGSVQSLAAVAVHPEIDVAGASGLDEAALRSWETIHLGDEFEIEAGSEQVFARLFGPASKTVVELLPFASVGWLDGHTALRYRMKTMIAGASDSDDTDAHSWLPALSARDGAVVVEHGNHQELGWERKTDHSNLSVQFFADRIDNPVLEAMSQFTAGDPESATVLSDSTNGLIHAAGPRFSSVGISARLGHELPAGNHFVVSYANGDALTFSSPAAGSAFPKAPLSLAQLLAGVHPRRTQSYSLSFSGTLEGSGTRWQASYSWQPEDTVTRVAPFAENAVRPYFGLHLRQPVRLQHEGFGGIDVLLDVNNLLAQGYRPFLLSDGSMLIFAQGQRSIQAGLVFSF